ncbi:MAG: S1 RNA-binding domain-containing protein [Nanoarchaeota archaeon]
MFYKRKGYPEEDEIVLCQVTKIFPSSVFVDLSEYQNLSGLVHISEVSPGRIRNLRDFVVEGKQIVCKILRLDREKGHIDLSLRRVNSTQRMEKLEEIKQEIKAETLIKNLSKKLHRTAEQLYTEISAPILKEYSHLYLCFKDIAEGQVHLEKLGVSKSIAEEFTAVIIEKFKPAKIMLGGELTLQTYHADGIEKIKSLLATIESITSTIKITYLGGGRYKIMVEDIDYKPVEKTLERVQELVEKFNDKVSTASFAREKKE